MPIPFTKAQAVGNDFLIVEWTALAGLGVTEAGLPDLARAICHRHYGVGADGLEVLFDAPGEKALAYLRLFNSDGSEAELSGNGTRCVAAYLVAAERAPETFLLATKAGVKSLRLVSRTEQTFVFEMGMGRPKYLPEEIGCDLATKTGTHKVTLVNVGNPQCVLLVDDFNFDWRSLGREIETLPRFPNRTNVSFVKILDRHSMDVRFWERGAGETLSSGTGSTGAGVAAILSGQVESPLRIQTLAGDLRLSWDEDVMLEGAAEITAQGEYFVAGSGLK
jgi:diaminopimelate epimerase